MGGGSSKIYIEEDINAALDDLLTDIVKNEMKVKDQFVLSSQTSESVHQSNSNTSVNQRTGKLPILKIEVTPLITNNAPVLRSHQSVRNLALRHHSLQQNVYIPQEVLQSFIMVKKKIPSHESSADSVIANTIISGNIGDVVPGIVKQESAKLHKEASERGLKKKPALKVQIHDEDDWIQVSDNEEEGSAVIDTPRVNRVQLSICSHSEQSYMFTNSGTIFVEGFVPGIGTHGIQSSVRNLRLPMRERLPVLCRLGQGASSVVFKAIDVVDLRIVALKMVSVYDRGKRRQMVKELSALFSMLRMKKSEFSDSKTGSKSCPPTPLGLRVSNNSSQPEVSAQLTSSSSLSKEKSEPAAAMEASISPAPTTESETPESVSDFASPPNQPKPTPEQQWKHIVDFFDAFSNLEDGGVALMVEYMDGGSLQDIVDLGGCDDEGTLSSIAKQGLLGLNFLHNCRQIHRDLKPANMLIDHNGAVKLSDFGILRQIDDVSSASGSTPGRQGEMMDRAHTFVGTVSYMAPERIDGREYSYNSDIWSLGLTILTLALGRIPLDTNGGFWSILRCVRDMAPPTLPNDNRWSPQFRDFIEKCLIQDPTLRPSSAQLLSHPFIMGAGSIDSGGQESTVDNRGQAELKSLILALHQHLKRLASGADHSVLLEAFRTKDGIPNHLACLRLILLAEDNKTDESNRTSEARLQILADQLHMPVTRAVAVAKNVLLELEQAQEKGLVLADVTPKTALLIATPKARHSSTDAVSS